MADLPATPRSLSDNVDFIDKLSGCTFRARSANPCFSHYLTQGIFEFPVIKWCEQYLTSSSTFVDIGAHMGTYAIILSPKCAKVFAFEAQASTCKNLRVGVILNDRDNIQVHHCALGAQEGMATLHQISEDGGGSTLDPNIAARHITNSTGTLVGTENVQMRTLDSFKLTNIDFLKIDVEGYELEVIQGAIHTLSNNYFPPFIFEAWTEEWFRPKREQLFNYLTTLGYVVIPITGTTNMYMATNHPLRAVKGSKHAAILTKMMSGNFDIDWNTISWEACVEITDFLRRHSKHEEALDLIQIARGKVPECYSYHLDQQTALCAIFVGDISAYTEGYEACERVILGCYGNADLKNQMLKAQIPYMKPLPASSIIPIHHTIHPQYVGSSSSIIPTATGFLLNYRAVNYTIDGDGGYMVRDARGIIWSKNYLLGLDKDLKIIPRIHNTENSLDPEYPLELRDGSGMTWYPRQIRGMEDVRLFGQQQFLCTSLESNPQSIPQVCYGEYSPGTGIVSKFLPLKVTTQLQSEKNWMPFIWKDEVHFIHTFFPLKIYQLNTATGATTLIDTDLKISPTADLSSFRGSGGLIPYNNGWLGSIHQVYHKTARNYFHRLIWFTEDFTSLKYSKVFYFDSPSIEFTLSLCLTDTTLLIPYSFMDNSSRIAVLPLTTLETMLG
jgi:FkbM family methyltransferase